MTAEGAPGHDPIPRRSGPMPDPLPPPPGRRRRILVVEDEYVVADDLRQSLEDMGAEVLGPVPSVRQALDLLAAGPPPDGAVLDVNLVGGLVFPLADVLAGRGIPFILATGYDASVIPAAYAGVPRCEKPYDARRCLRGLLGPDAPPP